MPVVLAAIEIADLQTLVHRYGCKEIRADKDPVGAAESVCRSMMTSDMAGVIIQLPSCHTLSHNPIGWSDKAPECGPCFDKLTCIVALHRLNKLRPDIQWKDRVFHPPGRDAAMEILPLTPPLNMIVAKDMATLSKAQVVAKAKMMGIEVGRRDNKEQIIEAIELAEGEDGCADIKTEFLIPQVDTSAPRPPPPTVKTTLSMTIEDLADGDVLWSKKVAGTSRKISCKITRVGKVIRWEVAGQVHKDVHSAATHGYELIKGRPPKRINPLRFWRIAGEYNKGEVKSRGHVKNT